MVESLVTVLLQMFSFLDSEIRLKIGQYLMKLKAKHYEVYAYKKRKCASFLGQPVCRPAYSRDSGNPDQKVS